MEASWSGRTQKLGDAGFPLNTLSMACQKLARNVGEGGATERPPAEKELWKIALRPYMHLFTHSLKKVAARYGVQIISARNKFGRVGRRAIKKQVVP